MSTERRNSEGSTSSCRAADVAAWGASQQQKRQRCQVLQIGGSIGSDSDVVMSEVLTDQKNKQVMDYDIVWQKKIKNSSDDLVGSSINKGPGNSLQTSEPDQLDCGDNEDYSGENEDDYYNGEDEEDNYNDDDEDYGYEFAGDDYNQYLADKFDDLDLPPGVEATVPWLQKLSPPSSTSEGPSDFKSRSEIEDEISRKYKEFKQFDTVEDFSDHHFANKSSGDVTKREWSKKIQHEWKLLETNLPASIYVRVYEERMDLLRAVIVGPAGTPYHDGLFFFDAQFPSDYPSHPPLVHYHAGGLRLNPNLYACGKVCLSLLGTWSGSGCEKWNSKNSTMLQVLLSIQALVLNEKPYFNEPGYEAQANHPQGEKSSLDYNENVFLLSCRTMLYSLRRPPKHFEDLVAGHFRERGRIILLACRAYMEGVQVGTVIPDEEYNAEDKGAPKPNEAVVLSPDTSGASYLRSYAQKVDFKPSLEKLFEELLMEFNVKGADTRKFLVEKIKKKSEAKAKAS